MVDFLEICERALNGPIITESDFDLSVFIPKLGHMAHVGANMNRSEANRIVTALLD